MIRPALGLFILLVFSFSVFAQTSSSELKTVELFSPIKADGRPDRSSGRKYCFSFVTESTFCGKVSDIYYGSLRSGNDWDWFQVMGEGSRNNIKKLGKKEWTDALKVPLIEPYAELKDGEQRSIVLGGNGNNRLPDLQSAQSQNSGVFPGNLQEAGNIGRDIRRDEPKSDYNPYIKAILGNMYVMRVVDENSDFYVLFRVDELEKGKRAKISWKRIEAPKED